MANTEQFVGKTIHAFNELAKKSITVENLIDAIQKLSNNQNQEIESVHIGLLQAIVNLKKECQQIFTSQTGSIDSAPGILSKRTLKIQTHWMPQAQFAGYYVAEERGFYREAGLNVELIDGGPGIDTMASLIMGNIDFATSWLSAAIVCVDRGAELKLSAQIFQKSGLLIVALRKSGIRQLQDLKKSIISSWGGMFTYPITALDKANNLSLQQVFNGTDFEMLVAGEIDAVTAMTYNELLSLYEQGYTKDKFTVFPLSEYQFGFPEDGLYSRKDLLENEPAMCQAFTEATLRGWKEIETNKDEVLDIVMKHHQRNAFPTSQKFQEQMLNEVMKLVHSSENPIGALSPAIFSNVVQTLKKIGIIKKHIDYSNFFNQL